MSTIHFTPEIIVSLLFQMIIDFLFTEVSTDDKIIVETSGICNAKLNILLMSSFATSVEIALNEDVIFYIGHK